MQMCMNAFAAAAVVVAVAVAASPSFIHTMTDKLFSNRFMSRNPWNFYFFSSVSFVKTIFALYSTIPTV